MNSTETADQSLLAGLRTHDERQIKVLYDQFLPGIINFVCMNSGTESDARDVFQEALTAIYLKVSKEELDLTVSLRTYLLVVCRNLWFRRLRKGKRTEHHAPEDLGKLAGTDHIDIDWDRQARNRIYFRGFEQLGEKCRLILSCYFDKIPVKQIAGQLDTSESFIKKKKYECKKKLIQLIHDDPEFREFQMN